MGYSQEYVDNMTAIHTQLCKTPDNLVILVHGPDQLCSHFPSSHVYHCEDDNIYQRDERILRKLGLSEGMALTWMDIEPRLRHLIAPQDIDTFCTTCSWRSSGLCAQGIRALQQGQRLHELPNRLTATESSMAKRTQS